MKPAFAAILALPSVALAMPATAQDEELVIEDQVIVTAPGPNRSADELIGNATALDREDLLESLAGSLGDTLDKQPGVASTFFGQGASRPVLRGLGAERVQVLTNGLGVIDVSAASPDHQVTADGIDATRVEILRGPAALAYGGQSIGGVVNVIDGLIAETVPDAPFSGDLFGAYNSVNEGSELAGRGQFAAGPFVFSLTATQRDFDNYDIPGFAESALQRELEEAEEEEHGDEEEHEEEEEIRDTQENSFVETQTLGAGLSWVGERGFFGVAWREQTAEYGLPGHGHEHEEEEGGEEEGEEEEENPFIDLEQTRIDVRGGYRFENNFITDVSGALAFADYEHTEFEAPGEAGTVFDTEGFEGRFEIGHAVAGFEGTVGFQFLDEEFSALGEEAFVTPTDSESFGVFLYETREWESGFGVEGGLRFETTELDNIVAGTREFDLVSGSFGAHRHIDDRWFIGAQVSYSERAPNESELFADGPHLATEQFEVGDPELGEESGINLEGSLRWTEDGLSLGVNLFITEFSDFIFLTPGFTMEDGMLVDEADDLPVFVFEQDDASFYGGELYGVYDIEEGVFGAEWELRASVDFVDAELDSGGNVPFAPPITFNVGTSAEWGAFEVGGDLTVAGDQDDPGLGQLPTDGYSQLDLRAEVDLSDFGLGADGTEAFIEARNVTDEEIRFATSVLKDVAPAPGRNIRIGVRVAF